MCPDCGRTMIRNLADSPSLLRALQNAAVSAPTPVPISTVSGHAIESITFDLPPPRTTRLQDTDSVSNSAAGDTDVQGIIESIGCEAMPVVPSQSPPIPGFAIEGVLGRGGMGTVYLARQLSLDRPVALKVMSRRWVSDPTFVARFTREAYAAARLSHPNLVQVFDIGEVDGNRYFSMEYVDGRSLADVTRAAGKLDPETAVGYILQAARGLKHAHDRGMIHRDIKPDNLILDMQGIVKVADLGLVKTPDHSEHDDSTRSSGPGLISIPADMTGARMALGTPAYMPPEQCRDAAAVDHRADIYSLGCTLYALVTGRQPFDGRTAVELMTKHAYTPLVPPEEVARRVPRELSAVIQKMMAKNPSERFQSMSEVIRVLEQWLGVHHGSVRLSAGESQIAALEKAVDQFNLAPTAVLRAKIITGFVVGALFGAILLTFSGRLGWAFGIAGLIIQSAIAYFLLDGAARGTFVFRRVRQFVLGFSIGDWLVIAATLVLFAILLWMLKLFWMFVGFGLIAVALAVALRYGLDRTIDVERQAPLASCERLLRRLRVQGLDEDQLRHFVAKYAGRHWEEFFESLFGYEAKIETRQRLLRGEAAGERERFAAWREPLVGIFDRFASARRADVERRLLAKVEEERLIAAGCSPRLARRQAMEAADLLLRHAADYRTAENARNASMKPFGALKSHGTSLESPNLQALLAELPLACRESDPISKIAANLIGPLVRGVLAIVCLAACGIWAIQNRVLSSTELTATIETSPLIIPDLPPHTTAWIDTGNIGLAGILLLTSLLYTGTRMAALVILGSVIISAAHHMGIPSVPPIRDFHVGLILGTVVALFGYRLGRR
jgi:eukaryotic-like serine/threonine-protein kinase